MEVFGRQLIIDGTDDQLGITAREAASSVLVVDVEDDEKGGFVGIGLSWGGSVVFYQTKITPYLRQILEQSILIGHNIKYDCHQLKSWGVDIRSFRIGGDTQLMSYVQDAAAESHSLKYLAKKHLGLEWSTYDEMTTIVDKVRHERKTSQILDVATGKKKRVKLDEPEVWFTERKKKVTLDKQPVEKVAQYCGSDVAATWDLFHFLNETMTEEQKKLYDEIELPTCRVLFDMECRGIKVDVEALKELHEDLIDHQLAYEASIEAEAEGINASSNQQLGEFLVGRGLKLPLTPTGKPKVDKAALQKYADDPFVKVLLEMKQVEKMISAFTEPMLALPTLPRIHPTFNQIRTEKSEELGISTGRLSCSSPNLQQMPRRSDWGKELRKIFVPDAGKTLLVSDFSQIEPRLMAHCSQDPFLLDVFLNGKDIYLSLIEGIPGISRDDAKTFWLAWGYGAGISKLARLFKMPFWKGQEIVEQLLGKMRRFTQWQEETYQQALSVGGSKTLFGRFRRIPELYSQEFFEKEAGKRKAINTVIQGTAADIMKLAMVRLSEAGYQIQVVVHDEVLISVDPDDAETCLLEVTEIMQNIVQLSVPLLVEAHVGPNWGEAKNA